MKAKIIATTMNDVQGRKVKEILGVVRGNTVRSRNIFMNIAAAIKTIFGGEVETYTELITVAREEAFERMIREAEKLGADAVIAMRFETSEVISGVSEMLAYGTAVKLGN